MRLRHLLVSLVLCVITVSALSAAEQPRYLEITLLSTNDIHSRLTPFDSADPIKNTQTDKGISGAARRMTIVNRVRYEMRTPVVLVDSGDTIYPNSWVAKTFGGNEDIAIIHATGYDALTPGNHDFEWDRANLERVMKQSQVPWVCANLVCEKTGEPFLPPYMIKEVGGVRVAFFGLITPDTKTPSTTELGLKTLPYLEVARKLVPELRQKADIVVLLSHLDNPFDVELAQKVPGIDVIAGGHWHSLYRTPRMAPTGTPTAFSIGAVPIVQAGQYGEWMGRTRLVFHRGADGRYTLMSCRGEVIHIDDSIPDDPGIARIIAGFRKKIPHQPSAINH